MSAVDTAAVLEALTEAIQEGRVVRLGFARQRDALVTIQHVAPVDVSTITGVPRISLVSAPSVAS
jgi:hypothetical protein